MTAEKPPEGSPETPPLRIVNLEMHVKGDGGLRRSKQTLKISSMEVVKVKDSHVDPK